MYLSMIVTVLAMATVQEAEEKDTFEFLKVSAKMHNKKFVKSSVAIAEPVVPIELGNESRHTEVPAKTILTSTQTKDVHPHEHQSLSEHHEGKHTHEHEHSHGHHAHHMHHTHHTHHLQAEHTDGKQLSQMKTVAEPEGHEAQETETEETEAKETGGSCYGNDSRCSDSGEIECDLLEHEGADCRWLGDRSSGSDDRSMAIAIHSLLAAFASSVY
jgi:hypothetical protein